MAKNGIIAAVRPNLMIGEWSRSFSYDIPRVYDETIDASRYIVNVTKYGRLISDRWVYVIAETDTPSTQWEVIHELYIDKHARTWVSLAASPYAPISERGNPVRKGGSAVRGFSFPRVHPEGKALWIRLLISRFRLPSATIRFIDQELRDEIRECIPPLWQWRKDAVDEAPLVSADHYGLVETPLYYVTPDDSRGPYPSNITMLAAMGVDPFSSAEGFSNLYVQRYADFKKKFEPNRPEAGSDFHRLALARMLDDAIIGTPQHDGKYGKHLDRSAIFKAVSRDKKARRTKIEAYEEAAFGLGRVMTSPLFGAYEGAVLDEEGVDLQQRNPRVSEYIRVLGRCARLLNESRCGGGLLRIWAGGAAADDNHIFHRIVLPTAPQPEHVIKATRWGAKALAGLLAQYITHYVYAARIQTKVDLAEKILLPSLRHRGLGPPGALFPSGTFDPKTQIVDVGLVDEFLVDVNSELRHLSVDVHDARFEIVPYKVVYVADNDLKYIQQWISEGELKDFGVGAKFLDAKLLGSMVLDSLNVALAYRAAVEGAGSSGSGAAYRSLSAASLGLAVAVTDAYIKERGLSKSATTYFEFGFSLARAATSAYYVAADAVDAYEAFRNNDRDHGYALAAAGLAEVTTALAYLWLARVGVSLGANWVVAIASLVAAAAYIVAGLTKDDPVAQFLQHCEWGKTPYAMDNGKAWPAWSPRPVGKLRKRFDEQIQIFVRVMSRVTVHWRAFGNPVAGVDVELFLRVPESTLHVVYRGEQDDGTEIYEEHMALETDLPDTLPCRVHVPQRALTDWSKPKTLVAHVYFRLLADGPQEAVTLSLLIDGKPSSIRSASNVGG